VGFIPGFHSGLNDEFESHSTGASIDWIESTMCAKSMCARSSAGVWYSLGGEARHRLRDDAAIGS
jgi:hypothetical protein